MIKPEENKHVLNNTHLQTRRLRDAGNRAENAWCFPLTYRSFTDKREFKRLNIFNMKRVTIITIALALVASVSFAQTNQPPPAKEDTITLRIPASKLQELHQVLGYSFQWLPTSDGKAKEVGQVQKAIQEVYPFLQPVVADKPKPVVTSKMK